MKGGERRFLAARAVSVVVWKGKESLTQVTFVSRNRADFQSVTR